MKDAIKTANELGLSANENFKRIVENLQYMSGVVETDDKRHIVDAIKLLQQQNAEINATLRAQQC